MKPAIALARTPLLAITAGLFAAQYGFGATRVAYWWLLTAALALAVEVATPAGPSEPAAQKTSVEDQKHV